MLNDTIRSRTGDLTENMKRRSTLKIKKSPFFTIQMDESTDVASLSQLLIFVRYIHEKKIE